MFCFNSSRASQLACYAIFPSFKKLSSCFQNSHDPPTFNKHGLILTSQHHVFYFFTFFYYIVNNGHLSTRNTIVQYLEDQSSFLVRRPPTQNFLLTWTRRSVTITPQQQDTLVRGKKTEEKNLPVRAIHKETQT